MNSMVSLEYDFVKGILSIVLILMLTQCFFGYKQKLPPGPWGIPLFGVMPFLTKPPYIKFQEYFKKYGKLCSCKIGNKLTVIISDFELIKQAFVVKGDIFSGRPEDIPFKVFPDDKGIAVSDGIDFKRFKLLIESTLKDVGLVEAIVKNNAEHFLDFIKTTNGKVVNFVEPLRLSIAQIYCQLLFGKRLQHDDPILKELISLFHKEVRLYNNESRLFLPWVKKIPIISKYVGQDELRRSRNRIYEIFDIILKENLDSYEEGSQQNFPHSWLTEDIKRKLKNPNDNLFGRSALFHNLDIIFEAGYETTARTLLWAFTCLLYYPDVQHKIMQELDEVVGRDRLPSLDDELFLPYTMATIQEISRCAKIAPLALSHRTKETTTLDGYHIPKNSIIYANVHSVHTDSVLFPDPHKFKPDRFIDEEGKFVKSDHILAFSIGKRQCPGKRMAHIEVFIYLTYILQYFRLEKAVDDELIKSNQGSSVCKIPMNFNIKFVNKK